MSGVTVESVYVVTRKTRMEMSQLLYSQYGLQSPFVGLEVGTTKRNRVTHSEIKPYSSGSIVSEYNNNTSNNDRMMMMMMMMIIIIIRTCTYVQLIVTKY
jgi:hypothetical protein